MLFTFLTSNDEQIDDGTGVVRDLMLDPSTGDLYFGSGNLALVSGLPAAQQGATIRCNFFQGEWFLDTTAGIPYFQRIYVKNPNFVEVREWFRLAVIDTPDIDSVQYVNMTYFGNRTLTVNWQAHALGVKLVATGNTQ